MDKRVRDKDPIRMTFLNCSRFYVLLCLFALVFCNWHKIGFCFGLKKSILNEVAQYKRDIIY